LFFLSDSHGNKLSVTDYRLAELSFSDKQKGAVAPFCFALKTLFFGLIYQPTEFVDANPQEQSRFKDKELTQSANTQIRKDAD
jgi:hypothetical protein